MTHGHIVANVFFIFDHSSSPDKHRLIFSEMVSASTVYSKTSVFSTGEKKDRQTETGLNRPLLQTWRTAFISVLARRVVNSKISPFPDVLYVTFLSSAIF